MGDNSDEEAIRGCLADSPGSGRLHHCHRDAIPSQLFRRNPVSFIAFCDPQLRAFYGGTRGAAFAVGKPPSPARDTWCREIEPCRHLPNR